MMLKECIRACLGVFCTKQREKKKIVRNELEMVVMVVTSTNGLNVNYGHN